jgi:hypothetical protein
MTRISGGGIGHKELRSHLKPFHDDFESVFGAIASILLDEGREDDAGGDGVKVKISIRIMAQMMAQRCQTMARQTAKVNAYALRTKRMSQIGISMTKMKREMKDG